MQATYLYYAKKNVQDFHYNNPVKITLIIDTSKQLPTCVIILQDYTH